MIREIEEATGARVDATADESELYRPRYNVAPTQLVPVVVERDGAPLITLARWGLVRAGKGAPRINVRDDALGRAPRGRCLVIADGFLEWSGEQPIHFRPPRATCFAGLTDVAELRGVPTLCAAIVTRPPLPLVAPVHDRMPAVLSAAQWRAWLELGARELLAEVTLDGWTATPVSRRVGNVRNDDAACLEPVEVEATRGQLGLGI